MDSLLPGARVCFTIMGSPGSSVVGTISGVSVSLTMYLPFLHDPQLLFFKNVTLPPLDWLRSATPYLVMAFVLTHKRNFSMVAPSKSASYRYISIRFCCDIKRGPQSQLMHLYLKPRQESCLSFHTVPWEK